MLMGAKFRGIICDNCSSEASITNYVPWKVVSDAQKLVSKVLLKIAAENGPFHNLIRAMAVESEIASRNAAFLATGRQVVSRDSMIKNIYQCRK